MSNIGNRRMESPTPMSLDAIKKELLSPKASLISWDFEQFKKRISQITEQKASDTREGIFDLRITYRRKVYMFKGLKETYTLNEKNCGFSRNHYYTEQPTKQSIFHDSEDVDVTVWKDLFVSAKENLETNTIELQTKKWTAEVKY